MSSYNNADLVSLVEDFESWQKIMSDLYNENKDLKVQINSLQKQCQLYDQSEKSLRQNNIDLTSTIETLQRTLSKQCHLETDNNRLKDQLDILRTEMCELESQHRRQMIEAVENLQAVQEAHKKELHQLQTLTSHHARKEVESLQKIVQDKTEDISVLQKQLNDTEREKHTEIVKLRLEYDAKLLKLQKQNSKPQASTASANSDIFRRKLQAAKAESEKEMSKLKKRIAELEKQVITQSKKQRKI